MKLSKLVAVPVNLLTAVAIAALVMLPFSAPLSPAKAAASSQTTHAMLCRPESAGTASGPGPVTNPNTSTTYVLNTAGCAVIAGADVGYFLSQGYYYGPSVFTLQARGITSSGTTAVSTGLTLPAYGYIVGIILCETAGNAVTGGVDVGDSGSITRFGSAVTLGANACNVAPDSGNARIFVSSGVPTADVIQVAAHAAGSWNSASVNITVLYSYW